MNENDYTTLSFSDDYTGINEFYIYGMNNIKTNLIYIKKKIQDLIIFQKNL